MDYKRIPRVFFGASLLSILTYLAPALHAEDAPKPPIEPVRECKPVPGPTPDLSRADVYKGLPYQPGEEVRYTLKYGSLRVHVGYGFLRVQTPVKQMINTLGADGKVFEENRWHRVYAAEAYTGDWYKYIFAGHDSLQSFSRPWDGSVTKFYINQNEEKPFVRKFNAEKWLDFDHSTCAVKQRFVDHKKKSEKITESFIDPGAVDAMSAAYKLRTFDYKLNKTERFLVYTSEQNWWLEATPVALESIVSAIGTHNAYKLQVKTYLGKELQQKGSLFVWIAADHPNHPILRIQGEVTFGGIYMEIDRFTPGVALDGSTSAAPVSIGGPAVPPAQPVAPVEKEKPAEKPKAKKSQK